MPAAIPASHIPPASVQPHDVMIVGAGMVGAALALALGKAGLSVLIIDQTPPAPFDPAAAPDLRVSALSAGSEAFLRSLGAWSRIEAMRLCPYRRLAVWEETHDWLARHLPARLNRTGFDALDTGHSHLGHIVENRVTQLALWQCMAQHPNIRQITPTTVRSLSLAADHRLLLLDNGQQVRTRLLIAADGAHSRLREMAGIGITSNQYAQQALVASVRYQGEQADITWQAFHPSGPRAFLPLASIGTQAWASLVWYDSPERINHLLHLDEAAFLQAVQAHFPQELPPLTGLAARAYFPLVKQQAQTYIQDRLALVGDAAHTINPLAGQGVNLGFQDADCLARLILQAHQQGDEIASDALLHRYEQHRKAANQRMSLAMDAFYHLFSNDHPPLRLLRNLGLVLAERLPLAKQQVARYAMGLIDS